MYPCTSAQICRGHGKGWEHQASCIVLFLPYILKIESLTENGAQIAASKFQQYSILLSTGWDTCLVFYLSTEDSSSDPYICEIKGFIHQATSTLPLLSLLFLPLKASSFSHHKQKLTFPKVIRHMFRVL